MSQLLAIDPEFEARCPPLTDEEYRQLEENILEEGLVLMPIIIWNNTIVDGHNRYKIAMGNPGVEFRTHEKFFDSRYEALSWICKNQLGRRNLTPQQKKYLIGQRYKAEKEMHGGDRKSENVKSTDQNDPLISSSHATRARIAEETHTSEGYVQRAEYYADGIDAAEEVLPGIRDDLLVGKYKPKETEVAAIARASPIDRKELAEQLRLTKDDKDKASATQSSGKHRRQDYQEIETAYEELKKQDKKVSEDDALDSLRAAVRTMIRVCNNFIENFPRLVTEQAYKHKLVEIMQEAKSYIKELEGDAK